MKAPHPDRRVVITGLGVVSSLGIGKSAFWEGLLQGRSGISEVSSFDTSAHFTHNGGEVKNFRPGDFIAADRLASMSRASQMALAAAVLAAADAGLSKEELGGAAAGICCGTTTGSIQSIERINDRLLNNESAGRELMGQLATHTTPAAVARELGLTGPNVLFSTACAAGNYAIGYGSDLIRLGKAPVVLAGGSDAFSRISFTGFNQFSAVAPDKCRPFDRNRKGMMVAEGAGFLVLESLESALKRGAAVYAEITGYGLSCDARHMTNASIDGIAACMQKALQEAGISREDVDYISAHGTGTATNDRAECAAMGIVFGDRLRGIPVSSIKSMLGHTMGAASALEAIACALAVRHDVVPPTMNFETPDPGCDIDCVPNAARKHRVGCALNNSYAFGGNNASLAMKKFIPDKERITENHV